MGKGKERVEEWERKRVKEGEREKGRRVKGRKRRGEGNQTCKCQPAFLEKNPTQSIIVKYYINKK